MTSAERLALANWQSLYASGKLTPVMKIDPPEPTIIQKSKVIKSNAITGVPSEVYHGEKYDYCLSAGKLKSCQTPLHLKRALENPTKNSANLNIGSAFHKLILEPHEFEYRLFDDTAICAELIEKGFKSPRATKEYKEWFKQFTDESGELADDVLPHEAFHSMWKLKKALIQDYDVLSLFQNSINECSIFMELDHPVNHTGENLKVKIRPDGWKVATLKDEINFEGFGIKAGDYIIISVKTTLDASPDGFIRQAKKMQYDLSEAFYNDVFTKHVGGQKVHTIFLTIEKDGQVFTGHYLLRYCTDDFLQRGRELYGRNLEVYCNSNDLSEGYQSFTKSSIVEI